MARRAGSENHKGLKPEHRDSAGRAGDKYSSRSDRLSDSDESPTTLILSKGVRVMNIEGGGFLRSFRGKAGSGRPVERDFRFATRSNRLLVPYCVAIYGKHRDCFGFP